MKPIELNEVEGAAPINTWAHFGPAKKESRYFVFTPIDENDPNQSLFYFNNIFTVTFGDRGRRIPILYTLKEARLLLKYFKKLNPSLEILGLEDDEWLDFLKKKVHETMDDCSEPWWSFVIVIDVDQKGERFMIHPMGGDPEKCRKDYKYQRRYNDDKDFNVGYFRRKFLNPIKRFVVNRRNRRLAKEYCADIRGIEPVSYSERGAALGASDMREKKEGES